MATNVSSILQTIIQGILAAVSAAPQVEAIIVGAKALISALFEAKLITAEQQNALHGYVDTHAKLASVGIVPPAWGVEPDPVTPAEQAALHAAIDKVSPTPPPPA